MNIQIQKATENHVLEIEQIHLASFASIGEKKGDIALYLKRKENLAYVALNEAGKVVGYLISFDYKTDNYLEWFGVDQTEKGIAQKLLDHFLTDLRANNVKHVGLRSRNRFKEAMAFYLKNNFDITGVYLGIDQDLMINFRKTLD